MNREVGQERWTSLDQQLQARSKDHQVDLASKGNPPLPLDQRARLIGRLQRLETMGLAREVEPSRWQLRPDAESTLRRMGERGDIIRTMQRALTGERRELAIFDPDQARGRVVGRLAAKGLADGLSDKAYAIVDGIDGRAHYVVLSDPAPLEQAPVGSVIQCRTVDTRASDRNVAGMADNGLYSGDEHVAQLQAKGMPLPDAQERVVAHVRRLEALRRAGIVERLSEGFWRVPADLVERGRAYDRQREGEVRTEVLSHQSLKQQTRVIGATWLDRELASGASQFAPQGFGADVAVALKERAEFLVEQGLAQRSGQRLVLARDFLTTLRECELADVGRALAEETGLMHRPIVDGQRITGIYRRVVTLASGRFAMLDDGKGFSLVPWAPVIGQRLGQSITAVMRGGSSHWEIGKQLSR